MVAASIWSLLIPAIEQSDSMGRWAFLPAAIGFWIGTLFLLLLDHIIPHLHQNSETAEGPVSRLQKTTMMILAVTLHNIPEGMAVGVVYAGYLLGHSEITVAGAMALSLGIAIQNFPEGAIISLPLRAEGMKKSKAFVGGVLSGIYFENKINMMGNDLLQSQGLRSSVCNCQHIDTEGILQSGLLIEHVGKILHICVALQFQNDTDSFFG